MTTAVAVRQITVNVTQHHIDQGRPCDGQACPVALAILDAVPGATCADVYWASADNAAVATIWLSNGACSSGGSAGPPTRSSATSTGDEPVGPFTFTMTIPEEAS